MISINIVGTLGADAEYKEIGQGRFVVNFSIAHTDKWKDSQGNQQERTTWFRCAYWVNSPKIAEYLRKGGRVAVYAEEIKPHAWIGTNGEAAAQLEVTVRRLELCGSSQGQAQSQPQQQQQARAQQSAPATSNQQYNYGSTTFTGSNFGATDEDDLPF